MNARDIISKNVSRETFALLTAYTELLQKWNRKINLISRKITISEIWQDHILDSLELIKFIANKNALLIDVGSGAGFPGLILAMSHYSNCYLVEKNQKKTAFLSAAAAKLGIKVNIINNCISKAPANFTAKYITSRAMTNISAIIAMTSHLANHHTEYVFHISTKDLTKEMETLAQHWNFKLQQFTNQYKNHCCIIIVKNVTKISA